MNIFLFYSTLEDYFILYFHCPSYTLPIIDLRTEQALCECCWHMFKHLASIICYLVNFSSWGAFLDGILEQVLGEYKICLIDTFLDFCVVSICAVFEVAKWVPDCHWH